MTIHIFGEKEKRVKVEISKAIERIVKEIDESEEFFIAFRRKGYGGVSGTGNYKTIDFLGGAIYGLIDTTRKFCKANTTLEETKILEHILGVITEYIQKLIKLEENKENPPEKEFIH